MEENEEEMSIEEEREKRKESSGTKAESRTSWK